MLKGKKLITALLFGITVLLLLATVYLNSVLQNTQSESATRVKKIKASAQTYHKYLALNSVSPTLIAYTVPIHHTPIPPSATPTPYMTATPVISPPSYSSSRQSVSSASQTARPLETVTPLLPTRIPTNLQPTQIVYHNPSPTIITSTLYMQSSSSIKAVTTTPTHTILTQKPMEQLPNSGISQYSTIFFFVAVVTLFIAFLF